MTPIGVTTMPEIYNNENGKPGENGWRLVSVWDGQETTGDYTVGDELIAYYDAPGFPFTAELTFYVTGEYEETGDHGWQLMEAGGDAAQSDLPKRYAWNEQFEFFASEEARDSGPTEYSHEGGSYVFFDSVEEANADARRVALNDVAWTFQGAVKIAEAAHA